MTEQERQIIKEWEDSYEFDDNHLVYIDIKPEFHAAALEVNDEEDVEDWEDGQLTFYGGGFPTFMWDNPISDEAFTEWLSEKNDIKPEWIKSWSMQG